MKSLRLITVLLVLSATSQAQFRTFGLQIGDAKSQNEISNTLNPVSLIKEYGQYLGLTSRRYYKAGLAQKTSLSFQGFQGHDENHLYAERGLSYYTTILSLSHQLEYYYLSYGPYSTFACLGANAFTQLNKPATTGDLDRPSQNNGGLAIAVLFGGGVNWELDNGWMLTAEFGYNFASVDNLEGIETNTIGITDTFYHMTFELAKRFKAGSGFSIGNSRQNCPSF